MGTHKDDDGKTRHDDGTSEGGRWASPRLPESAPLVRRLFPMAAGAAKGSVEAVDESLERLLGVIGELATAEHDERTHSTSEGAAILEKLRLEHAQAHFEAHEATNAAGATIYAEIGKTGAEDILMSVEFNLPTDAASLSAVAHAAMDDEKFALQIFERAGGTFAKHLDEQSVVMILEHESEKVRVAAILAGALQRKGDFTTEYIGKNPHPAIVDAANCRQAMTGRADRYAIMGEHLVSESEQAGVAEDRLTTLAKSYEWKMTAPKKRLAA